VSAIPPFSGFYSKDAIIESVKFSIIPGATYAYICLLLATFVTALYIFRVFFYTFHTEERFDAHARAHLKESPWVITLPLILLLIPSAISGFMLVGPMLFSSNLILGNSVFVLPQYDVLNHLGVDYHGALAMALHDFTHAAFWFGLGGLITAYLCYVAYPQWPQQIAARFQGIYRVLVMKYGFDDFNQAVLVRGTRGLANIMFHVSDVKIIDDWMINGSARLVGWLSQTARKMQTGYLYHYALVMVLGLVVFLWWVV
jgi:NADH-quinone oxidoreductase subunit L